MGFARALDSRLVAVGAGAVVIAVLAGGTAGFAAGQIHSRHIADGTIRGVDVADGSLRLKEFDDQAVQRLQGQQGPQGEQGLPGEQGPAGPTGEDGGTGSALVDELRGVRHLDTNTGQASVKVGTIELPEGGTYLINAYGLFFGQSTPGRTAPTHLYLGLTGPPLDFWADDYGTCSTGVFSEHDLDATCQVARTIEVTGPTTVEVQAKGWPESDTVGGEFDVIVDVSAIKVAPPS